MSQTTFNNNSNIIYVDERGESERPKSSGQALKNNRQNGKTQIKKRRQESRDFTQKSITHDLPNQDVDKNQTNKNQDQREEIKYDKLQDL
eukprot:403349478